MAQDLIAIRTYERGVEDETLACGTGAVAAALVSAAKYAKPSPLHMKTRSSSVLTIHFSRTEDGFSDVHLEGDARVIYEGEIWPDAWVE
jgi:diaminopimelate epimerase